MICTPGFVDIHPHFDSVQQLYEYQNAGFTTVIGGGSGPKTVGIECPGVFNIQRMLEAMADIPLNFGNFGKGNAATPGSLVEQILAGATGLKIHEDWSSSPAAIETTMELADEYDFQVQIHADTLNETGYYEDTIAAINGRVMHIYHCEGAGGGNAPDMMRVCGEPNLLPSSTNPTNPFSINTYDEEIDMLITCHNLNKSVPTDIAFIQGRARAETMRAEDVLHDMGAISMIGSDSQGVGRAAESAQRSFQLAAVNKVRFGRLSEDGQANDNFRIKRYLAKVTINPSICFGVDSYVGSITPGKLADLVFWRPEFFIAKPEGDAEGRLHLARGHGRPGGLADDRPAAQVPPAVRLPRRQSEADLLLLRDQGGDRQWPRERARDPAAQACEALPHNLQARHDPQRRAAGHRDRPRDLQRLCRWRARHGEAGENPGPSPSSSTSDKRRRGRRHAWQSSPRSSAPSTVCVIGSRTRTPVLLNSEERASAHLVGRSEGGRAVRISLPRGTEINDGDVLALEGTTAVVARAAPEALYVVSPGDAYTWGVAGYQLGNLHRPVRFTDDGMLTPADPMVADLLTRLGIAFEEQTIPFVGRRYGAHGAHHHHHDHHHDH